VPLQPEELLTPAPSLAKTAQSAAEARLDLASEVLRRFGEIRFIARGSSMIPSIYPGDLLTVRSHRIADARHGQIVLCLREGRFWAHRIIRKWRDGNRLLFATRGDALHHEDPLIDESQLLGSVTSIVRYGKPVEVAHIVGPWMKVLRMGVRHSGALARTLLSRHALRMRLLGHPNDVLGSPGAQILECL
jgi:peptidase S24-like protein